MSSPMEVEIWGGDWGLPSVDIDCLQILVYGKFSGAPIKSKISNNPFRRTLPTFRHGSVVCKNLEDVADYLRSRKINADLSLTKKQLSEVQAYSHLLKEKLYPGLQYVWWVDNRNYIELTRPWYAKILPFPFNYYYPGAYERRAKDFISTMYNCHIEDLATVETQVYSDAEKCLTLLSNRLGEANYFFGTQPTSFDALIYSYLAPLLKTPFPNAILQNHLKACTNLVKFVDRISQKYFSSCGQEYDKRRQEENLKKEENDFPHKRRNQIFAGIFAFASMAAYGLSTGLLQVNLIDDADDPDLMMLDDPEDDVTGD